ncbi:uncharacterized protein LOC118180543 [Stegodyphus dumicola]|uniref:uncharacterized protein LOC118180543 n=1 Tax=Stegodyphus dumicola TaxID=202533 RepID=UPI0015ADEE51|nr:uncharacterized protein LOC118180543 [Stegodyphus dumicola]
MLYPLVESSLPDDTLRAWQRFRVINRSQRESESSEQKEKNASTHRMDLDGLLSFLLDEIEGEERVSIATQCFTKYQTPKPGNAKHFGFKNRGEFSKTPSASTLIATSEQNSTGCIFCAGNHASGDCFKARKMTSEERQKAVLNSRSCFLCLDRKHVIAKCKKRTSCVICGKKHHILLCRNIQAESKSPVPVSMNKDENTDAVPERDETLANLARTTNVFLQTLTVTLKGRDRKRQARAIIDSASQRSYILKSTADEMKFESTSKERLSHSLFGGSCTDVINHDVFTVFLSKTDGTYHCNFKALSQDIICGSIPPVANGEWIRELKENNISVCDDSNGPIEILIGADIAGKLMTGGFKLLTSGLAAIETKLGWTLFGKNGMREISDNSALLVTSMLNKEILISDLWSLDSLGILDPSEKKSKLELQEEAVKRLASTVKRLKAEKLYDAYGEVFSEWEREGVIEEVPKSEIDVTCHYLPHRHVVKENSTTRIRPVFDASAKQKGSPSLNDCLEKGQNLIELIPSILHRFRMNRIGVSADIRKAFLQISLNPKDKDYLRFLWYRTDGKLKYYRHCRVVFGVTSSPFLLVSVIHHLLESTLKQLNGNPKYKVDIIEQLKKSFYCLERMRIPRWLNCDREIENISLHFFSDASKLAYSAVAFVRVQTRDSVQVHLVQAKARVAPSGRKKTTIARLELLGATICARLASSIIPEFQADDIYFWTDSSTVLAWIQRK